MPSKAKAKRKSNHGGARAGAGRKPVNALACPMCVILARQLELAAEREKMLMKQLDRKDAQIGTVIENKFETVRIPTRDLPQSDKPAMPIEQLMDVDSMDDQSFVKTMAEMTQ